LDEVGTDRFSRPELLPERIAQHLRGKIAIGSVKPGERLTEQALTREYDVSRVPLREALRILSTEGLISLLPHRGATVAKLSEKELRELFGVRSAIEEFAARTLAAKSDRCVVEDLTDLNRKMQGAIGLSDTATYEALALQFHDLLVQASGNELLTAYYGQVKVRFRRYQAVLASVPSSSAASILEHSKVLTAISRGEPDAAAAATRDHIGSLILRYANWQKHLVGPSSEAIDN
jgi:DNA-binding GntR family transcriptional regulator